MPEDPTNIVQPFQGFDIPRQNWFKMPNNWTNITADIASIAELKVVEYVLKHTWGYQEYGVRKKITNDEFMNGRRRKDGTRIDRGTGLSKPSVIAGLKAAVERGLLIEEIDDSDKARVKKYYSLRMIPGNEHEFTENGNQPPEEPDGMEKKTGVKDLNAGVKDLYPEVKKFYPRGKETLPRTEKDTIGRNLQTETNSNNNEFSESRFEGVHMNAVVVGLLTSFGIGKKVAQKLADEHTEEYIREKIDFLEFLRTERPDEVQKPAGWLRKAIEDNYGPPDGFKSPAERAAAATQQAQWEEEQRQIEAEVDRRFQEEQARRVGETEQKRQAEAALITQLQEHYGISAEEQAIWSQVLADLDLQMADTARTLMAGSTLLQVQEGKALVAIRNGFMRDWVQRQLSEKIQRALGQRLGHAVIVEVTGIKEAEAAVMEKQN